MKLLRFYQIMLIALLLGCSLPLLADHVLPQDGTSTGTRFTETNPPVAPVRPVAEFEPASDVLIRYPLGIPVSLVAQLANTAHVICIVASSSQSAAASAFSAAGTNMANVSFMNASTDSYWTRDFGPWFVFDGNDQYGLVDFVYNRPRPNDNLIPQTFANLYGLNYYGMNLQQTGGNYMADGIRAAMQTTLVYEENSNNQTNVNTKMHDYLGIDSYHVVEDPNNTYIDHIDCWAKLLAPDKVMVRSVPQSHAQYSAIEAAANYFTTHNCSWGYPYRVYRVNTPSNQPYTNSLILNKKVFVPTVGGSYDTAALQSYRDAMPGYEVIGVTQSSSAPWESTDALHCRTHEIPDKNMLYISHIPKHGTVAWADSLTFDVQLRAYSNQPLYADSLFISYKINSGTWQRSYLQSQTGVNYLGVLSGYAPGDTIRYFVHAADQSGHSYDHPVYASLDPHVFVLPGDQQAPVISHTPISTISNFDQPYNFVAEISDNVSVGQVWFRYRIDANPVITMPMDLVSGNNYLFQFYPQFQPGESIFYYGFTAYDNANPPNMASLPEDGGWWAVPISPVANDDQLAPAISGISSVYPNPFHNDRNGNLKIAVQNLPASTATLKIFNIKGQLIYRESLRLDSRNTGEITWNGCTLSGENAASGIYFLKIDSGSRSYNSKLLITK